MHMWPCRPPGLALKADHLTCLHVFAHVHLQALQTHIHVAIHGSHMTIMHDHNTVPITHRGVARHREACIHDDPRGRGMDRRVLEGRDVDTGVERLPGR